MSHTFAPTKFGKGKSRIVSTDIRLPVLRCLGGDGLIASLLVFSKFVKRMGVTYVYVSWNLDGDLKKIMFYISVHAIFSQPSIYIDGWLYGMRMTSVVCNVPVLSQNDSTYHHSVFTT